MAGLGIFWAPAAPGICDAGAFHARRSAHSGRTCPLPGERVRGVLDDAIDVVTLLGAAFGVATFRGIGLVRLNVLLSVLLSVGFAWIFGLQKGPARQIVLERRAMTGWACRHNSSSTIFPAGT